MSSRFNVGESTEDLKQPTECLNVYTLFLLLENQRNTKLREIYQSSRFTTLTKSDQSHEVDTLLPKYPPRYQCLHLSVQGLVLEISKLRRDPPLRSSTKEQWKSLDRATKTFLEDAVNILRDQCDVSSSQTRCSTPPPARIASRAITPPSSPSTVPLATSASEDSPSPLERYCEARRKEVNMSDDEILSLWNCTVPTADGIGFDVCLGTTEIELRRK